jgi:hypothetical protein
MCSSVTVAPHALSNKGKNRVADTRMAVSFGCNMRSRALSEWRRVGSEKCCDLRWSLRFSEHDTGVRSAYAVVNKTEARAFNRAELRVVQRPM